MGYSNAVLETCPFVHSMVADLKKSHYYVSLVSPTYYQSLNVFLKTN